MRALVLSLALTAFASGCNSDPCAGKSGVCLGARVVGDIASLDQIIISIPNLRSVETPSTPAPFTLPVKFAMHLPAGTQGALQVSIDGRLKGQSIAHAEMPVTIPSSGHADYTFTLLPGALGTAGDMSGSGVELDMTPPSDLSLCPTVTQCMDGDGCCPSGCNYTTDHDCTPVCGNGVIEKDEVCDDGNTNNGDGCDPTCTYTNTMTPFSGRAGNASYADGPGASARFLGPTGITTDNITNIWIADGNNTVRVMDLNGTSVTTLAGRPGTSADTDGTGTAATFTSIADLQYVSGSSSLFILTRTNALYTGLLRQMTLADNKVTTISSTTVPFGTAGGLGSDGTLVYICDASNGLRSYNPTTQAVTTIVSASSMFSAVDGYCQDVAYNNSDGFLYFTAGRSIGKVATAASSAVTVIGNAQRFEGCDNGAVGSAATFTNLQGIAYSASYVGIIDYGCQAARTLYTGNISTAAGNGTAGWLDSATATSGELANPYSLAFVYNFQKLSTFITDHDNSAVRFVSTSGLTTIAGSPVNTTATTGAAPTYVTPSVIASDGTSAYVVDTSGSGELVKVNLMTGAASTFNAAIPASLLRLGSSLYAGFGDGTIKQLPLDGSAAIPFAGLAGMTGPPSDQTLTTSVLDAISLATDGTKIYFVDAANTIRVIDATANTVSTIVGMVGSTDLQDGAGASAHFANPTGLSYANGMLYVLDGTSTARSVVRRIDIVKRKVDTVVGAAGMLGGMDGVGAAARFSGATGMTSDGLSLFVTDGAWSTTTYDPTGPGIRQIQLDTFDTTTMIGARGQYGSKAGTGIAAVVDTPGPIVFDPMLHELVFGDLGEGSLAKIK